MGVGWPDGSERPIAFVSRSLAPAEKKYSVPDREEGLAIIYEVKRFLLGRYFIVHSDHKPLRYLHVFRVSTCMMRMDIDIERLQLPLQLAAVTVS